jgi:anti-anti-sigma regulatory factor
MQVKIDTKEKFTVVTPIQPELSANIAAEIAEICNGQLLKTVKNVVLNMANVSIIDEAASETLSALQQKFYESSALL